MKLTKYLKINFVILKIIEVSLLCLVPFWMGKLSNWLYVQTDCFMFKPIENTIFFIWLDGILLIAWFVAIMLFSAGISAGTYFTVKQNMKWAKKLAESEREEK